MVEITLATPIFSSVNTQSSTEKLLSGVAEL